jgi:hypothetical protein
VVVRCTPVTAAAAGMTGGATRAEPSVMRCENPWPNSRERKTASRLVTCSSSSPPVGEPSVAPPLINSRPTRMCTARSRVSSSRANRPSHGARSQTDQMVGYIRAYLLVNARHLMLSIEFFPFAGNHSNNPTSLRFPA